MPWLMGLLVALGTPADKGVVEGVVVRAVDQKSVDGAEVMLRAKAAGQWLLLAQTVSDSQGKFHFEDLPVGSHYRFQAGANHDGIYYPGPSVRLSSSQPRAEVRLAVHDAVAFPNPLVVRQHTITLSPKPDALEVTESMVIDNPSQACYVGQASQSGTEPVTLHLSIPADFTRVTFAEEFFGRRCSLVGGKLATSVPWPPGRRELAFSYVLPAHHRHLEWRRSLDLPTSNVKVVVRTDRRATRNQILTAHLSGRDRGKSSFRRTIALSRVVIPCASNWGTCQCR